jgi:hypothetical protein
VAAAPNPKPLPALLRHPKTPAPPWTGCSAAPQTRPRSASASPHRQEASRGLHPRPRHAQRPELHPTLPLVICSATSIPRRRWFPDLLNPRSISAGASRVNPWSPGAGDALHRPPPRALCRPAARTSPPVILRCLSGQSEPSVSISTSPWSFCARCHGPYPIPVAGTPHADERHRTEPPPPLRAHAQST